MDSNKTTYFLALEIEPMEIGKAYEQLPMYCTIMPRFHTAFDVDELVSALEPVFVQSKPTTLTPGEHLAFGPQKQLVTLVTPTEEITNLHQALFDKLNKLNVQYAELEWVGEGFIPHVTDKHGECMPDKSLTYIKVAYLISVEHPLVGYKRLANYKFVINQSN